MISNLIKNQNKIIKFGQTFNKCTVLYSSHNNNNKKIIINNSNKCIINNNDNNVLYKRFYSSNSNKKDLKEEKDENSEERVPEKEDPDSVDNKYGILLGTDKSILILEDSVEKDITYEAISYLLKIRKDLLKSGNGLASNLSFFEYFTTYIPKRSIPMESPFFKSTTLTNELFTYNPFLLILPHPRIKRTIADLAWKLFPQSIHLPLDIDPKEFLENSSNALKSIYRFAKDGNSEELQELSCQPATLNLLLLRDAYYTIDKHSESYDFNQEDLDIDNFEFEPIDARPFPFESNDKVLRIETRFKVTSDKFNEQQQDFPVIIKAYWISPTDEFDWRIFEISYETDYDT